MADDVDLEVLVQVGSKTFSGVEAPWDTYITQKFVDALYKAGPAVREVLQGFHTEMLQWLQDTHGSETWNGGVYNPTDRLQVRSGEGIASIRRSAKIQGDTLDNLVASMGTGDMTVHETGATISAKSAKYLTIPLPAALDRRGLPLKKSAREWDNTFVQTSKKGNLIIFQKQADGSILPLYLLKPSVTIKPRLGMAKELDRLLPRLQVALIDALDEVLGHVTF